MNLTREEALIAAKRADSYPKGKGFSWGSVKRLASPVKDDVLAEIGARPGLVRYG
mgnify:FL=1